MKEIEIKCPKCNCKEKKTTQIYCSSNIYNEDYQIFKCDNCKCEYEVRYKVICQETPVSIRIIDRTTPKPISEEDLITSFKLEYDSILGKIR